MPTPSAPAPSECLHKLKPREKVKVNTIELGTAIYDRRAGTEESWETCKISESTYRRIMGHKPVAFRTVQHIANILNWDIRGLVELPAAASPGSQDKYFEQRDDVNI